MPSSMVVLLFSWWCYSGDWGGTRLEEHQTSNACIKCTYFRPFFVFFVILLSLVTCSLPLIHIIQKRDKHCVTTVSLENLALDLDWDIQDWCRDRYDISLSNTPLSFPPASLPKVILIISSFAASQCNAARGKHWLPHGAPKIPSIFFSFQAANKGPPLILYSPTPPPPLLFSENRQHASFFLPRPAAGGGGEGGRPIDSAPLSALYDFQHVYEGEKKPQN